MCQEPSRFTDQIPLRRAREFLKELRRAKLMAMAAAPPSAADTHLDSTLLELSWALFAITFIISSLRFLSDSYILHSFKLPSYLALLAFVWQSGSSCSSCEADRDAVVDRACQPSVDCLRRSLWPRRAYRKHQPTRYLFGSNVHLASTAIAAIGQHHWQIRHCRLTRHTSWTKILQSKNNLYLDSGRSTGGLRCHCHRDDLYAMHTCSQAVATFSTWDLQRPGEKPKLRIRPRRYVFSLHPNYHS